MPEVVYPTSDRIDGIWLISREALEELDEILCDERLRLVKLRDASLKAAIAREHRQIQKTPYWDEKRKKEEAERVRKELPKRYPYSEESYGITLHCKSKAAIRAGTFSEAFHDQTLQREVPIGFEAHIVAGEFRSKIELSTSYGEEIAIEAGPLGAPASGAAMLRMRSWALKYRLPRWCYLWMMFGALIPIMFPAVVGLAYAAATTEVDPRREVLRDTARALVDEGLDDEELNEAVEMILVEMLQPYPSTGRTETATWFWFLLGFAVLLIILSVIPPRSVVGIGGGEALMKRRMRRVWFVSKALPRFVAAFVVLGVLASVVGSEVYRWLSEALRGK